LLTCSGFVRELLERHHAQWSVDPDNLGTLDHLTEEALHLLARMRLVEITPFGAGALPAVHRYRNPSIRTTKKEQAG
jgi:hypothetical protein